jgi:hypothetical protein
MIQKKQGKNTLFLITIKYGPIITGLFHINKINGESYRIRYDSIEHNLNRYNHN